MNKISKIAIVVAGVALAVQGAHAAANSVLFDVNNNNNGGSTEYDVNLGTLASLITAAGTTGNVDLNGDVANFSTYNYATASGLNVGAAGGQNGVGGLSAAGNDAITATLRVGNAGNGFIAGTEAAPSPDTTTTPSKNNIESAGGLAKGYSDFGANVSIADAASFTSIIASTPTANGTGTANFTSDLGGDNPLHTMTGSTITLDIWQDTTSTTSANSGWVYEGDLVFNTATDTLTFDAVSAVPEPGTYGVLAGFGLLVVSLRRQLTRKNA